MTEYVYIIGRQGSGLVKIGKSVNPERRLTEIQTTCPTKVEILWRTEGGFALERRLHRTFKELRRNGEWFNFGKTDPIAAICAAMLEPPRPPRQKHGFTPVRNLRVPDEVWDTALANARAEGKTVTEVIIGCLKRYNAATARSQRKEADDSRSQDA